MNNRKLPEEEQIWRSIRAYFKFISDSMGLNWILKDRERGEKSGDDEKSESGDKNARGESSSENPKLGLNLFDEVKKSISNCPEPYSFLMNTKHQALSDLAEKIRGCTLCELHKSRKNAVPGEGDPESPVMFVGEAPGYDEDRRGRPFVGKSGRLLRQKIKEILGLDPSQVYITNVVRCRPPENRTPHPEEIEKCKKYLFTEIAIVKPKVVVCLGNISAKVLLNTDEKITSLRGNFFPKGNYTVFAMFHPAFIVRNTGKMPVFEEDMRKLKDFLEGKIKLGAEEEEEQGEEENRKSP